MSIFAQTQCLVQANFKSVCNESWFALKYWQKEKAVLGRAQGRGNTWFVKYQDTALVLRHYLRGGLVAKYSKDHYVFTGAKRTRCFAEFVLNEKLYDLGLPVAKPVAARFVRRGLWYTADFIGERVADSQTLLDYVQENPEDTDIWRKVKKTVARFHAVGLNHVDLNVRNILVDSQKKIYLIDFDGCDLKGTAKTARRNFARLSRSVRKDLGQQRDFS